MNPPAAGTAKGARDSSRGAKQTDHTIGPASDKPTLTVQRLPDGSPFTVIGRDAQTLALLMARGKAGLTSGEAFPLVWARRTSAYVFNLRRLGLDISAKREWTPDGARVARYRLETALAVVNDCGGVGQL